MATRVTDIELRIERLSSRIEAVSALADLRFTGEQKALDIALDANDKRLEGMNEFRASINDITTRMMTRIEALSILEAASKKTDGDVEVLRDRLEVMGKPNYPLLIGLLSTTVTILAGAWLIIGLKIDNTMLPVQVQITATTARIEAQLCADDAIRNLARAQDMRIQSVMWQKVFPDTALATDNAFYPQVCARATN